MNRRDFNKMIASLPLFTWFGGDAPAIDAPAPITPRVVRTEFEEAFDIAWSTADMLGVSADELSEALDLLSQNGIRAANAGASMRAVMSRMIQPTERSAGAMAELGIEPFDSDGDFVGLVQCFEHPPAVEQHNLMFDAFGNCAHTAELLRVDAWRG